MAITSTGVSQQTPQDKGLSEKQLCEIKGNIWDEATNTCKTPEQVENEKQQAKEEKIKAAKTPQQLADEAAAAALSATGGTGTTTETPEQFKARAAAELAAKEKTRGFGVLKDEETGRLSGFTRGGQTLLGLSPQEVRALAEKEAGLQELEVKGQAAAVLENREEQEAGLRAAAGIAQTPFDPIAGVEQIELDKGAAAMSALRGIIPDFLGSLAGIAGAKEVFGGKAAGKAAAKVGLKTFAKKAFLPVNVALAAAATIGGFYQDFMRDLERQRSQAVEAPIRTLTETKPLINDIINAQNANPQDRAIHIKNFERQKQMILDDYDNLKELTDSDLTQFLGINGINQLKEYDVFFRGEMQQMEFEFADALANPDPSKIRATSEDIKEMKRRMERALLNE